MGQSLTSHENKFHKIITTKIQKSDKYTGCPAVHDKNEQHEDTRELKLQQSCTFKGPMKWHKQ